MNSILFTGATLPPSMPARCEEFPMVTLIARRLLFLVAVLLGISLLTFVLAHVGS